MFSAFTSWRLTIILYNNSALIVLIYDILSDSISLISKQILFHRTNVISLSTTTIYNLAEFLVLSLYLIDDDIGNPCPIVSNHPVCPLILECTTYDP